MNEHRIRWRVGRMCELLGVSRSGFYAWQRRGVAPRTMENQTLIKQIRRIYDEGRGEYGSPTVYHVLREQGCLVNHKRVSRLMQLDGLRSKAVRRFKRTTRPCVDLLASPNLLEQNFRTDGPNRVWLSDITYVDTPDGWLYLTMIKDMWSRRLLGYAITDHMRASAVRQAVEMALGRRTIKPGLIFHSDRGKQYTDGSVRAIFKDNDIRQSMSRSGNCYDNAMAESFFATLKKGHIFWQPFESKEQARRMLFEYLEIFYNRVRRHSSLGYKSPVAFEQQHSLA